MATLTTKSAAAIVQNIAAGMQGRVSALLNFAVGSVFRAIAEAYSGPALWLQGLALEIAKLTRLATSFGSDVDSFIADFDIIERLGAQAATGLCSFSRFTAGPSTPFIPVGATVQTGDGTQPFAVAADPTNTYYSTSLGGYTMPAQVTAISAPVQALNLGVQGNVAAGSISQITSAISGIDSVVNVAAFSNGIDQEGDAALKVRFQLAIASLSKATPTAMAAALGALQAGIQYTIRESVDLNGAADPGMVTIVIDDGSGAPSAGLVANCAVAVNTVRAAGIRVGVYAATTSLVSVTMSTATGIGYDHDTVVAQVVAAITAGINATGLGNALDYFKVAAWALAVPGVTNVTNYTLNGAVADLPATPTTTYKAGSSITVS